MPEENEITLGVVGLMLIIMGLIVFSRNLSSKWMRETYAAYLVAKKNGEKPTDEMMAALVTVYSRRICLASITIGLTLLAIHYLKG